MGLNKILCLCGCGKIIITGNQYLCGHGMKGKHHSAKTKAKISKTLTGRTLSKTHIENVRLGLIGYRHSEETKHKMSLAAKGKPKSEKHKKKLRAAQLGKCHTKEAKIKIGLSSTIRMKKLWKNPGFRKRNKGHLGKTHTKEAKEKMSQAHYKCWEDSNYRENQLKAIFKGSNIKPNKPEKILNKLLNHLFPNEYRYVGNGQVLIGGKCPDFININEQKKIIELFGDYWHSKKVTGLKKKEHRKQRQEHFAKYGYKTLVVWEHELKDINKLKNKLIKFYSK